jgi:hypothetical protein
MKRIFGIVVWIALAMTMGCASLTPDVVQDMVLDKTYNVIFEDKPDILKNEVYANNVEIGKIVDKTLSSNNMVVVRISVKNEFDDLMTNNVVFYVSDGRLEYDTVGEAGKPLAEGAKILGFGGKPSLYLFKTKTKLIDISGAAVNKAEELYKRAFGGE